MATGAGQDDSGAAGDLHNPYTPGRPVVDPAMFFGRAQQLAQVAEQLEQHASQVLTGPRTIGTSSMAYYLAHHLPQPDNRRLPVYVDLTEQRYHTAPGLLNGIWQQWWAQIRPGSTPNIAGISAFDTAVRKLNPAGFHPVLFLDEIEQLLWRSGTFGDELFENWRSLVRDGMLTIIATAQTPMAELFRQSGLQTEFYELLQQVDIGLLDHQAAVDMLTRPAEAAGLEVPDGAADYLVTLAGPHPFFLQIAGFYFFNGLAGRSYSRATITDQFSAAAEPYWQDIWDSLTPLAQSHYPLERQAGAEGMTGRQLRILANRALVIPGEDGSYRPFSDGFANWASRLQRSQEAIRVA